MMKIVCAVATVVSILSSPALGQRGAYTGGSSGYYNQGGGERSGGSEYVNLIGPFGGVSAGRGSMYQGGGYSQGGGMESMTGLMPGGGIGSMSPYMGGIGRYLGEDAADQVDVDVDAEVDVDSDVSIQRDERALPPTRDDEDDLPEIPDVPSLSNEDVDYEGRMSALYPSVDDAGDQFVFDLPERDEDTLERWGLINNGAATL